jgi:peroxin-6
MPRGSSLEEDVHAHDGGQSCLDGISDGGEGVFVIGATNKSDLLDQTLLCPGRFEKMLYLGVSYTHDKQ